MESSAQIKQLQRIKIDHKLNASEENAINYAIRYIKQNELNDPPKMVYRSTTKKEVTEYDNYTFYTIHITTATTDVDVDTLTVLAPTAEQALNEALNKYGSDYIYDIVETGMYLCIVSTDICNRS